MYIHIYIHMCMDMPVEYTQMEGEVNEQRCTRTLELSSLFNVSDDYKTTLELEHHYPCDADESCGGGHDGDGDADDLCVLCHQPLLSSSTPGSCILDFLPDESDYYSHKTGCKTTGKLACGHRFCALGILFHMYALGMQCPICRSGPPKLCG